MLETARMYLDLKLSVLPAIKLYKRPCISWKEFQRRLPIVNEVVVWFDEEPDSICVVTGKVSDNLEIIDFDNKGEQYPAWKKLIPNDLFDKLVIEQTPSGGFHAVYRCETEIPGNQKFARRKLDDGKIITLIETRGEGGLFLCAPTNGYKFIHRDFSGLSVLTEDEREILILAAWSLNEYTPKVQANPVDVVGKNPEPRYSEGRKPGEDFSERGNIRDILKQAGWTYVNTFDDNERWRRPGKKAGWSATLQKSTNTFYVFSSNAMPFENDKAYSPFAVFAFLECNGVFKEAARLLSDRGYGDKGTVIPHDDSDVDLSELMSNLSGKSKADDTSATIVDPGPIPDELMQVPGFISDLMEFTLKVAPYPNKALAFCGALAMQSFLCGRKIKDEGNLRTNIYLLALAGSGTGKDCPRQVNSYLAMMIGKTGCLADRFASGEGLEDALEVEPSMLFQTDEIDSMLRTIKNSNDGTKESMTKMLLTLYSAAQSIYALRRLAGKQQKGVVNQPHLTLLGTATPTHFYESLSREMLSNGFFARMMVIDIGKRGKRQKPGDIQKMPQWIIEYAQWWIDFKPSSTQGNLYNENPEPLVVFKTDEASEILEGYRDQADSEFANAEKDHDDASMAIWNRAGENALKLALLYTASVNDEKLEITAEAAKWSVKFTDHLVRRMLFMVAEHVAENEFDKMRKRIIRKMRKCKGKKIQHSKLLGFSGLKTKQFKEVIDTMKARGDLVDVPMEQITKPGVWYVLKKV